MKNTVLVILCFLFSLVANGAAVMVNHLQPVAANVSDTATVQTVEKPNYRKGKVRIVTGIIIAALAGVCFYTTVPAVLSLGALMLAIGGIFMLAGLLSLIDQSVRYKQRKSRIKKVNT